MPSTKETFMYVFAFFFLGIFSYEYIFHFYAFCSIIRCRFNKTVYCMKFASLLYTKISHEHFEKVQIQKEKKVATYTYYWSVVQKCLQICCFMHIFIVYTKYSVTYQTSAAIVNKST